MATEIRDGVTDQGELSADEVLMLERANGFCPVILDGEAISGRALKRRLREGGGRYSTTLFQNTVTAPDNGCRIELKSV